MKKLLACVVLCSILVSFSTLTPMAADFSDDFTNGISSAWTAISSTAQFVPKSFADNPAIYVPEKDDTAILLTKEDSWTDCTVETRYMVLNQKGTGGLQLRSDATGKNAYILRFIVKDTESTLNLSRLDNDTPVSLKTFSFAGNKLGLDHEVGLNKWYDLKAELQGNTIRVFVNQVLVMEVQDTQQPRLAGAMGFRTYSASVAFDDFKLTGAQSNHQTLETQKISPIVPHYATKTGIALTWPGTAGATEYIVTRLTANSTSEIYRGNKCMYFDTGLTPGASYQYTLTAVFDGADQTQNKATSEPVSFSTLAADCPGGLAPAGYQLEFEDNFDSSELDETKWFYRVDEASDSAQVKEAVTVENGNAVIHCKPQKTGTKDYQGGGIVTKKAFSYGYYEARVKYAVPDGWHPSFWTSIADGRQPRINLKDLERLEIDINEFEMGMWDGRCQTNVAKWWDYPSKEDWKQVYIQSPNDVQTEYHVWGAEFTPELVKFYLDGQLVTTTDISMYPPSAQHVYLSCIGFLRQFGKLEEGKVYIDYFRFYKNPQQLYTHDLILCPSYTAQDGTLSTSVIITTDEASKLQGKTLQIQVSDSQKWLTDAPVEIPVTVSPQQVNGQFVFTQPVKLDCTGTDETNLRIRAELDYRAATQYYDTAASPAPAFSDMTPDYAWAQDAVQALNAKGIIQGKGEEKGAPFFSPGDSVTRAEFAKLILGAIGQQPASYQNSFADVAANEWFAPYLQACKDLDLIDPAMISSDRFFPDQPITREEMTAFVVNAYQKQKAAPAPAGDASEFQDSAAISSWAESYVGSAVKLGIVLGKENNQFDPAGQATRAEAAVIIYRLLRL